MRFASGIETERQCQTTSLRKSTKALWRVVSDKAIAGHENEFNVVIAAQIGADSGYR